MLLISLVQAKPSCRQRLFPQNILRYTLFSLLQQRHHAISSSLASRTIQNDFVLLPTISSDQEPTRTRWSYLMNTCRLRITPNNSRVVHQTTFDLGCDNLQVSFIGKHNFRVGCHTVCQPHVARYLKLMSRLVVLRIWVVMSLMVMTSWTLLGACFTAIMN